MTADPGWIGTAELARLLGTSRDYVQRQCSGRHWPHRRIGKRIAFDPADVAWIVGQAAVDVLGAVAEPRTANRPRKRYPTYPGMSA